MPVKRLIDAETGKDVFTFHIRPRMGLVGQLAYLSALTGQVIITHHGDTFEPPKFNKKMSPVKPGRYQLATGTPSRGVMEWELNATFFLMQDPVKTGIHDDEDDNMFSRHMKKMQDDS